MVDINTREASGLVLAYLGDAVWELLIRTYFINQKYNIKKINKLVKEHVNAKVQSKYLSNIIDMLDKEELQVVNRAKNSNIKTFPKSCTIMEYRNATAFEALIGLLHAKGEINKIEKIIKKNIIKGE